MIDPEALKRQKSGRVDDLTGRKFGRLTVIAEDGRDRHYNVFWMCACECGSLHRVNGKTLRTGETSSCGCWRREHTKRALHARHGHARKSGNSATYRCWKNMLMRCLDPKNRDYRHYGGRGIGVCERWRTFDNFLADMGVKPNGLTIDRIDNDRGYEPGNCRWVTQGENNKNRRPREAWPNTAQKARL